MNTFIPIQVKCDICSKERTDTLFIKKTGQKICLGCKFASFFKKPEKETDLWI